MTSDQTDPRVAAPDVTSRIIAERAAGRPNAIVTIGRQLGMSQRAALLGIILPIICLAAVLATLLVAPVDERPVIILGTLVALAAGLASASVGVYGGVMVPGLLLLGIDPRFVAALTLFLQLLVIPLAAGSHYRMGNFSRRVALPLVVGGVIGGFAGPLFAAALPKELIARLVAALIVIIGAIVLTTHRLGRLDQPRPTHDVPRGRVAGIGLTAGFSSGISGAGWGPIGITMLLLARIDPRQAVGSSLFARMFMASAAVIAYVAAQTAFQNVTPDWWLVLPLLAGSIAPMIPGALMVSRLGRERATVGITLLSIALALPTLVLGV